MSDCLPIKLNMPPIEPILTGDDVARLLALYPPVGERMSQLLEEVRCATLTLPATGAATSQRPACRQTGWRSAIASMLRPFGSGF